MAAPESSVNGPLGATRSYASARVELAELDAIRQALGGTLNDVVLAISAGALRRLLLARGDEPPAAGLRAQIPVNIRSSETEHALGNVLTSLFVELPVAEPDAIARHRLVVGRVAQVKRSSQPRGGKALIELAGLAPPIVGELLGRAMFGGERVQPDDHERSRLERAALRVRLPAARGAAPTCRSSRATHVGIAVASYAGGLVSGLSADRTSTPDLDVLARGIETSISELKRAVERPRAASVSA